MLLYVTLCYSMLLYVTLCYSMLLFVTLCYSVLLYVTLCYSMLLYDMLLYVTLHFALCFLCSPFTAHFCTFTPFAKQWSALHCFCFLKAFLLSSQFEMARHCAVQMDVVCTVWEQGLIPSAQCKVDEAQVLSLNRATWPDHLVSDQTVVIQAKTEAKLQ